MTTKKRPNYLRRYSDLPALFHLLSNKSITLLDPTSWDDKNDTFYLSQYKNKKNLKTLHALCFSYRPETYHHWHVFSTGPAGVCILFDRVALLSAINGKEGISHKEVEYKTFEENENSNISVDCLPFLKRAGFKPEGEHRVIFESKESKRLNFTTIPIDISCIKNIRLSPWLHPSLVDPTINSICAIEGCAKLKVWPSTLISNEEWKELGMTAS